MDYEKMWYELKQYLIEINELDILVHMNEEEVTEVFKAKEIKVVKKENEDVCNNYLPEL